jgi:hypothetical protein
MWYSSNIVPLSRQAAYQRRRRNGLKRIRVTVDPQEVRELLRACGLTPTSDEALATGLQMVVEMFSSGELSVRVDDVDGQRRRLW